jgi:glycosyltransferase involved in cell wall biosynthesis
MRSGRQDLIIVESPPLFIGFAAIFASIVKRASYIFNISDLWPESAVELGLITNRYIISFAEMLEMFFYHRAGKLSAQTRGIIRSLVKKGIPEEEILFLPNGVDTERFKPCERDKELERELGLEDKFVILYAGTMGYAHGLEVSLDAANFLRTEQDIEFLLVETVLNGLILSSMLSNAICLMCSLLISNLDEIPRYYSLSNINLPHSGVISFLKGSGHRKFFRFSQRAAFDLCW